MGRLKDRVVAFLGLNQRTEHFAESSSLTELQVPVSDHLASKVQECELDAACPPPLSAAPTVQVTTGPCAFVAPAKTYREHECAAAPVIPAPPPPRRKVSPSIAHASPPRASTAPFAADVSVPSAAQHIPGRTSRPAPPPPSVAYAQPSPRSLQPFPHASNRTYAPPPPSLPDPGRPNRTAARSPPSSTTAAPEPLHIAAGALSKLSSAQRNLIFDDLLRRLETGPVSSRAAAAETLFNSTSDDEAARQRLSAMGVVRPLVHLLSHQDVKGQMYAAYTLSALTSIEMSRADMRECDAVPALLRLIASSDTNLASKKGAIRALCRLARADDCAMLMLQHGVLPTMVDVLCSPSPDPTLLRRSLITLYFIGADKPEMQVRFHPCCSLHAAFCFHANPGRPRLVGALV
jgi:hypothetical protein